jgi:hypothetical protein
MVKKLFTLFCGSVIAFSLSTAMFAQGASTRKKMDKNATQTRWEGNVIRSDPQKSTLTVRKVGSRNEMTIHYDSGWVSQEHGSKKVNEIDSTLNSSTFVQENKQFRPEASRQVNSKASRQVKHSAVQ